MRTPRFYDFRKRGNWYRLVPSTSIVLFFLTMAMMLWTLDTREGEQLRTSLARDALWAEQTLQLRMEDNLNQVTELARGAGRGDLDESGFQIQASQFLANTPELIGIVRADTGMILRWIAPYEAGFLTPGSGLSGESASAFVEARIRERPIYSAPYQGPAGDWRFELQVPIFRDGQFVGSMVAIFSAGSLIRRLPPAWFAEKYQLELVDKSGRELARNAQNRLRNELYETLALPGTGLSIVARPVKSAVTQSHLLQTGLIGGLTLLTLLSLVSLNRHIHRRQDAERERDRVYRLSQELLGVVRRDTTILQVNPAFGQALGYPGETLVGTSFLNYLYPDARETAREIFERLFEVDGADRFEETRVVTRGGEVRWIVWALSPLRDSGVVYLAGRDITAEKQAEEALKREFAFRQAMEDSLVVGIRAIDLTGRITYVNPAFCTITGFSATELIGILPPLSLLARRRGPGREPPQHGVGPFRRGATRRLRDGAMSQGRHRVPRPPAGVAADRSRRTARRLDDRVDRHHRPTGGTAPTGGLTRALRDCHRGAGRSGGGGGPEQPRAALLQPALPTLVRAAGRSWRQRVL